MQMLDTIILTCVLLVTTPQGGEICIKPDGTVQIPADVPMDRLSRQFWDELAKMYVLVKQEKCI